MHFTVHLRSDNSIEADFSYGLVFIPCPIWVKGATQILNLNPERPDLQLGSVAKLMEAEGILDRLSGDKQAVVLIHPVGHGSLADLATLQRDLLQEGFRVSVAGQLDLTGPCETRS